MKKKILLSIIIPVYNCEKYLEDCLNSIFANNNDQIEIIIINDGSTDTSESIIEQYSDKYKNIIFKSNNNHGVSYTRNEGISLSHGKYIMFVDSDDILVDDWYSKIESYLKSDNDLVFFSSRFVDNKISNISKEKLLSYIITNSEEKIMISGPYSKLYKNDIIKQFDICFDTNIINGEDMLFSVEALMRSDKTLLIKDSFYKVRHNRYSSTRYFNEYLIKSEIFLNERINKILSENSISNKDDYNNYIFYLSLRALIQRLSYFKRYNDAKKYYRKIIENSFYKNKLTNYKIKNNKMNLIIFLLKNRLYFLLFIVYKTKNMKNNNDYFELL